MTSLPPKPPGPPPPEVPAELPAEAAADAAPQPAPDAAPEAAPDAPDAPDTAERRRPRGRTSLIIASAALLGIVAGLGTGYTVQADRKPTPLQPLSQAKLSYPDEPLSEDEYEPVPAKHDRRVKTDGDLRKLLVDKPKGARNTDFLPIEDGRLTTGAYARQFESPGYMFGELLTSNVRRVAATDWESGEFKLTTVSLVQFHDLTARSAVQHAAAQQSYMPDEKRAGNSGHPIEGSELGRYWVFDSPYREPGLPPLHTARALAYRGDIVMDVYIMDIEPISEKEIRDLAERQLERL